MKRKKNGYRFLPARSEFPKIKATTIKTHTINQRLNQKMNAESKGS